jgi:hypothetical protein
MAPVDAVASRNYGLSRAGPNLTSATSYFLRQLPAATLPSYAQSSA